MGRSPVPQVFTSGPHHCSFHNSAHVKPTFFSPRMSFYFPPISLMMPPRPQSTGSKSAPTVAFLPQSTSPSILDVTVVSSTCYIPPECVPCPCPHVCTEAQALVVTAHFPGLHMFSCLLPPTRTISKCSSNPVTALRDNLQPAGAEGPDSGTCRCIGRLVCMLPALAVPQPDPLLLRALAHPRLSVQSPLPCCLSPTFFKAQGQQPHS